MPKNPGRERLLDFNFMRRNGRVLVSNEFSRSAVIKDSEFRAFAGSVISGRAAAVFLKNGFYKDALDFQALMPAHYAAILKDWAGPRVHIIAVTGACDHACDYCGASASGSGDQMSLATAKKTVDFIFGTASPELVIEFQGGEPLLNFKAVRAIIEDALGRGRKQGRKLHFSIVSNLAGLTAEKLEYLRSRSVTVCTSLDGPEFIHDRSRLLAGGSHCAAVRGISAVNKLAAKGGFEPVNAICTVTRFSLPHPEKIVDEFLKRGIRRVQLGPLEPLGRASGKWEELGYNAEEFLNFYSKAFAHMLRLNRDGVEVYEKGALAMAKHIISGRRPRYQNLDLLCRLAYGCDGSVYGSDEARLLAAAGDAFFRLGGVDTDTFSGIVSTPLAKTLLLSCFPRLVQPRCARCPYNAYCRVSPVYNYAAQGSFWGDMVTSQRCRIFMGVFDLVFDKLNRPADRRALENWVERYE